MSLPDPSASSSSVSPSTSSSSSSTGSDGSGRAPRRWLIVAPVALMLLLAIGWTGLWFYAADRASQEIDNWIAAEAAQGRTWSCADRQLGGFPFRFELICEQPSLVLAGPGQWKATAARAHAVAQVWNPGHIIAEFAGPAELTEATTGRSVSAQWSLLQVSAVGTSSRPERMSLMAEDFALSVEGKQISSAREAVLHVRHHPGADEGTLDIATGVKGARGMLAGTGQGPEVDGELQASVTAVPDFRPMVPEERIRLWQEAGGRVKLQVARLSAANGVLNASGEFGLDAELRLDGTLDVAMTQAPALMSALSAAGLMPGLMVNLAPAMTAFGSPTTLDGAPASGFRFTFTNGRAMLGMIPLGRIGPVL